VVNVEQTDRPAGQMVFFDRAEWIENGQTPTGEVNHPPAGCDVPVM